MDLCLLVDSSGSIRFSNPPDGSVDNWQLQLDFLSQLIEIFDFGPQGSRVGAVVFAEQVNLAFTLDMYTDVDSVKEAIRALPYLGESTNTPEGLRVTREQCFSRNNGDRPQVQNVLIVISDGLPFPESRKEPAMQEADLLKQSGTIIIPIGVTTFIDREFLESLSSPPHVEGQNFFLATEFTVLDSIRTTVGVGTCEMIEGTVS